MQHALNRKVHRRTHAHVQQFDPLLCSLRVSLTPADKLSLLYFYHTGVTLLSGVVVQGHNIPEAANQEIMYCVLCMYYYVEYQII